MDLFTISAIIISLSALFGYINIRWLKLPTTIGLMVVAILFTVALFATAQFNDSLLKIAESLIGQIDFEHVLLDVLLGFLLFAGALHTNFDQLRVQRWPVLVFSTLGVVTSTLIIGFAVFYIFNAIGFQVELIHCFLFGALISPTDPIAVLGILKQAGVPKILETKIVGESLFNDGVGVVVFLTIMSIATAGSGHEAGHGEATAMGVAMLFGQEVIGGIILGGLLGYGTYLLMRTIDDYDIEVMITLACVMGGYALAHALGLSAPLAMVVAGLIVGNDTVRGSAMSATTEQYVDKFWELMDMLMNAILFVLIGLELLILDFDPRFVTAGIICIAVVLLSRYLSLILPVRFFSKRLNFVPNTATIMTWGGLRGGISIALALSLPETMNRDLFLTVTYAVVIFSIIVQGLTVGRVANKLIGDHQPEIEFKQ
jgi:CPA1 family monovalent cation:H+ antiporter